jgi:hypothetical protein
MSLIQVELARAQTERAQAKDERAHAALDGVIFALKWAIEDSANEPPAQAAARMRSEPDTEVFRAAPAKPKAPAKKR